jgi:DNA-binding NarL/FixJ family response regulator
MINRLTERETQILKLIANGLTNKIIAQHLLITESTVENHIHHIYGKLNTANRAQATAYAFLMGIMSAEKAISE